MAIISAFQTLTAEPPFFNSALTLGLRAFAKDEWPPYTTISEPIATIAATTSALPVSVSPKTLSGYFALTRFDDYYNRVHLIPGALDLGNIFAGVTRTVDVWNAFLAPKIVGDFDPPADPGVQVTQPISVPYTLGPIDMRAYTVSLTTEGSPIIDDALRWTIGGLSYAVPLTGRRVVPFPLRVNWGGRVDETLEWLTSIDRAYDGTEQRISARAQARRAFEFSVRLTQEEAQRFENLLYGWSGRLYGVPVWPERSRLTAQASAGATALSFPTANRGFLAGKTALLLKDHLTAEIVEIATVSPTGVTLTKPVAATWPTGSAIYPTMISRLEASTAVNRLTDATLDAIVRFAGSPGDTDPRVPTVAAPATYLGYELYLRGTNWKNGVGFEYESDYGVVDELTGVDYAVRHADIPAVEKRHQWILKNAADITDFRAWLGRRKGRAVPVWMPTGTSDFTLVDTITSVAAQMNVKPNGFDIFALGIPEREHILVRLRDGQTFTREIQDATPGPNGTITVYLSAAFGISIEPTQVKSISFLGLWRLASDAVVIGYESDSVAVVEAVMRLTKP